MTHLPRAPLLVALVATLLAHPAGAQLGDLRKAAGKLSAPTPSLASLFGGEPPITTTLADVRDPVPSLDGFTPPAFSPLNEMPRGPGGTFLLLPGAYMFVAQSYCMRAGTYGPHPRGAGAGYLYAEWKGPKAEIVRNILNRAAEHPEIPRPDIQVLMWAITARTKLSALPQHYQLVAARLLSVPELAELNGYALTAVPAEIGRRVLKDAPQPLRQIMEAENDMRRLLTSTAANFEDLERVAVLTGTAPPDEEGNIPAGRWSYHPNGYFIRFTPHGYQQTHIQIYYPKDFQLIRDAQGRITSVVTPDQQLELLYQHAATFRFASVGPVAVSGRPGTLLQRARADLQDLAALDRAVSGGKVKTPGTAPAAARALIREATHSALGRWFAVRHNPGWSMLQAGGGMMKPFQPGMGGAMPGGKRNQRVAPSGTGGGDDALDKAKKATGALSDANTVLGAATSPADLLGGFIPGTIFDAGMNWAYETARSISNATFGDDGGGGGSDAEAAGEAPDGHGPLVQGAPDYAVLFKPRQLTPYLVSPAAELSAGRAVAVNAVLASTLRTGALLDAALEARRRRLSARRAGNDEWQSRQGYAEVYLKREAGQAILQLSEALAALDPIGSASITEDRVRQAQARVRTEGMPAEAVALEREMGRTPDQIQRRQAQFVSADAAAIAANFQWRLRGLRDALKDYGAVLTALPAVPSPWQQ